MNVLFISVSAPPKTGAESLQVARFLATLSKKAKVTLVTTEPVNEGWRKTDDSLNECLDDLDKIIQIPAKLNKYLTRICSLIDADYLQKPDSDFLFYKKWNSVIGQIHHKPDVIYARASPFSSILLGIKLKEYFDVPLFSHFSDPFYYNPYSKKNEFKRNAEKTILEKSDMISFTTELTKKFYEDKYPSFKSKFLVIPNVYPHDLKLDTKTGFQNSKFIISYTGNLYGKRNFSSVLEALKYIEENYKEVYEQIEVNIAGNIQEPVMDEINRYNLACLNYLGVITQTQCTELNSKSDLLVVIDKELEEEIDRVFLPSKILDYIVLKKVILAVTPLYSESYNLINDKFGVAFNHDQTLDIADFLIRVVKDRNSLNDYIKSTPPEFYSANHQTTILLEKFQYLLDA
ncbi:glycosyltransferase family protein [Marinigracilibium pacificum]|uniref:Glycosyltransferase family 4 protein n=1 Tax=Marinigracilibium pacificum TaxID=2729599 RepID=A0A848IYU2_9BACT|nr:hypothetical protein [Marinigracilibium pacificum]NMM48806.1 glycosyltransferase family 4 protein [Marinigracilibium pacificum]